MDWHFIICTIAMIIVAAMITWALRPFDDLKEILERRKILKENKNL